ncbi:MAG: hypothetical protein FWG31_10580, partial [Oscillospiraceae bacterium]|nr:hypothetical protein [Oscillospiraceae bacterium]
QLNDKLTRRQFGYLSEPLISPPVIILICGGDHTDDYRKGFEILKQNRWFQAAVKIAFAIGSDVNLEILEEFTGNVDAVFAKITSEVLDCVDNRYMI